MKRVDIDPLTKMLIVKFKFKKGHTNKQYECEKLVRSLPQYKYSSGFKAYLVPPDYISIQRLWDANFKFPEDWQERAQEVSKPKEHKMPYHMISIPDKVSFLRDYQKTAIQFLRWRKGRGLIGDDMGLGKTIEALAWIKLVEVKGPALIIVPSITKPQWKKEYKHFVGNNVEIIQGKKPYPLQLRTTYIINWEILQYWVPELLVLPFSTTVADEIQYAGNMQAKRTKALLKIARKTKYFIPMSGTPVTSKTIQFFPCLHLLDPAQFPSQWQYMHRYCDPKHNGFGMEYKGLSNGEELHNKISKLMIRRNKRDVLKDMPPTIPQMVLLDIGTAITKYRKLEKEFYDTYDPHSKFSTQMQNDFNNIKLQLFEWKLDSIIQWITEFSECGRKLVVGVWHKHVAETLHKKFSQNSTMINGSITGKKREKALNDFYNNTQILFLQMKSGGTGLDGLQKVCSDMAFVELGDTPTIIDQFIARLDRSGQTLPVNISYLIGLNTVEEEYLESLDDVRQIIAAIMDGKQVQEKDLLSVMLEKRRQRLERY